MRKLKLTFVIVCLSSLICCIENKPINKTAIYGNTFIAPNHDDFEAPEDWQTYDLCYDAFQIRMPKYMKASTIQHYPNKENPTMINVVFNYRDSTNNTDYHYGRIGIDYYISKKGEFASARQMLSQTDMEMMYKPIIERALAGGKLTDTYKIPDAEIINGPFYDRHIISDVTLASDVYYRRKSNTGEGPVSCHIFVMQNKTEAVGLTVSYHDRDSLLFDNLFNIVKTFKWKKIND